jgi:hypothetical protein
MAGAVHTLRDMLDASLARAHPDVRSDTLLRTFVVVAVVAAATHMITKASLATEVPTDPFFQPL